MGACCSSENKNNKPKQSHIERIKEPEPKLIETTVLLIGPVAKIFSITSQRCDLNIEQELLVLEIPEIECKILKCGEFSYTLSKEIPIMYTIENDHH